MERRKGEKAKPEREKIYVEGKKQLSPNVVGGTNGGPNLSVDTHLPPMCERAEEKNKTGGVESQGANLRACKMILARLDSILDRSEASCRAPWHWASNCGFGLEFPEWDRHRKVDLFNSKTMICMNRVYRLM